MNQITYSKPFKFKSRFTNNTNDIETLNIERAVPLKYPVKFSRPVETSLINFEVNVVMTWSANYVICKADENQFLNDTKLFVQVVTLSTQFNTKLLQQLKLRSKGTVNWNKYQSKLSKQVKNQYLDYLIDSKIIRKFVIQQRSDSNGPMTRGSQSS